MTSETLDLHATLHFAETLARQAGAILREYYERPRQADHKSTSIDLVTEADGHTEAFIVQALHAAYPDHHVHGEEGGGYGPPANESAYHWWVDPLDGTTNFAHRFPAFAVSIALSDPDLHPILGVVYDPIHDEMFKGLRGAGATVNGRVMRVSNVEDLAHALVITGFPYDAWTAEDNNSAQFAHFVRRTQGARRVGSAALDICYVAAGRCDLYWEPQAKPWDVQAGIVMLLEAGGKVTNYAGEINRSAFSGTNILATNGRIHEQGMAVLQLGDAAPRPSAG